MSINTIGLNGAGALVAWTFSDCDRTPIRKVFAKHGLDKFVPRDRSNRECLAGALQVLYPHKDHVVKPHKDPGVNGYEVMRVQKDEAENKYPYLFSVKPDKDNPRELAFWNQFDPDVDTYGLIEEYRHQHTLFTGEQIGSSMIKVVTDSLGGIRTRDKGGMYWLPETIKKQFVSVADDLCQTGEHRVDVFTLEADARTVETVRHHIAAWVAGETLEIQRTITGSVERSVEARQRRVDAIKQQVAAYGALVDGMRDDLNRIADTALLAGAVATADEEEPVLAGI